jgi:hypothetical protein
VKVAEIEPLAMLIDCGTVRFALLLLSDTTVDPAAACESVTVQVPDPPGESGADVHAIDNAGFPTLSPIVAVCDDEFRPAVMIAVLFAVNCVAVAVKLALEDPLGIVTDEGTVRLAELEARLTTAPLEPLNVTVHVLAAPGARLVGAHVRALTVTAAVLSPRVAPVAAVVITVPVAETPKLLVSPMDAAVLPESFTTTVATTPSPIVVVFTPEAMQEYPLAVPAHTRLLAAASKAPPAVTLKLETAPAGYVNVHPRAEGGLDALPVIEKFRLMEPPAATVPDESVKVG